VAFKDKSLDIDDIEAMCASLLDQVSEVICDPQLSADAVVQ
jgi:hypothetical protein